MMHRWLREFALCFAAGAAGGAAKGLLVLLCSYFPASAALGGHLASALYAQSLPHANGIYARVVWGGLYGFLFLLPVARGWLWFSGFLWACAITLLQWVVLPLLHGGLHIAWIPLLSTLLLNCIWGWVAALLLHLTR